MDYKEYRKRLNKFLNDYKSDMKTSVNVRTGALKNSIKVRDNQISMLFYGQFDKVWGDMTNPVDRLEEALSKEMDELADAFKQDILIELKDVIKKKKIIK